MIQDIVLHSTPKEELRDLISETIKAQLSVYFPQDKETDTRLLSRKKVSEMLGVSLPTLHSWTKDGVIPAVRLGGSVKYRACDIENALKDIQSIKYSRYKG